MDTAMFFNWLPDEAQNVIHRLTPGWSQDGRGESLRGRVAIVGLPGVGKKTLCNSLWGWEAIAGSEEAIRHFGLITLIDLPADQYDAENIIYRLENAELILYVLDATSELQQADFNWISRLRSSNATLLIAANKAERLTGAARTQALVTLEQRLARPVLPLVAQNRPMVQGEFLQAVIKACPALAEPLAAEIAVLRRRVAHGLILRGAISGMALSLDAPSERDESVLTAIQLRLVRRIAALYGYKDQAQQLRELLLSNLLRFALRGMIALAGRFPRVREWLVSGVVAVTTTLIVGRLALAYYGGEVQLGLRGKGHASGAG